MFLRFLNVVACISTHSFIIAKQDPTIRKYHLCLPTTFELDYGQFGIQINKDQKKFRGKQGWKRTQIQKLKLNLSLLFLNCKWKKYSVFSGRRHKLPNKLEWTQQKTQSPTRPRLLHSLLKPKVILAVLNSRQTTPSLQRRKRRWGAEVRTQALAQRSSRQTMFFPSILSRDWVFYYTFNCNGAKNAISGPQFKYQKPTIFNWSPPIYSRWINFTPSRALFTAARKRGNSSHVWWSLISLSNHLGNMASHTLYAIPWALSAPLRRGFLTWTRTSNRITGRACWNSFPSSPGPQAGSDSGGWNGGPPAPAGSSSQVRPLLGQPQLWRKGQRRACKRPQLLLARLMYLLLLFILHYVKIPPL